MHPTPTHPPHAANRIVFLDGLRGIAILLVVLYHAYTRWSDLVPYGERYAHFPLAQLGWLGVELFFMISGFVIYMTLEKCRSFGEFLYRRWLRLFPAMLLVSLGVYWTAGFFSERPAGAPHLQDLVPGLTFIDPWWIRRIFRTDQGVLEGVFWSLFVEAKFYLFFGFIFFAAGRTWAKRALGLAFTASLLAYCAARLANSPALTSLSGILDFGLSFAYFGWFLVGTLAYELCKHHERGKLALVCLLGIILSWYEGWSHHSAAVALAAATIVTLFMASIYWRRLADALTVRPLLFFGFISYPFYLMHENLMIAMVRKLGTSEWLLPDFLIPVVPVLIIAALSYLIASYLEPAVKRVLQAMIARLRPRAVARQQP